MILLVLGCFLSGFLIGWSVRHLHGWHTRNRIMDLLIAEAEKRSLMMSMLPSSQGDEHQSVRLAHIAGEVEGLSYIVDLMRKVGK